MTLAVSGWADRVKDIAPLLGIASAVLALLQDQFRVLPKRLAPYLFLYGALAAGALWVFTRVSNRTGWASSSPTARVLLVLEVVAYASVVAFVATRTGIYPRRATRVRGQPSVTSPKQEPTLVAPTPTTETIDGYWNLTDFSVLTSRRDQNTRTQAITSLRLAGGSVLLDIVLQNLADDPLLLDELECRTKSRSFAEYALGASAGRLPISGVYHIHASVGNVKVVKPMEPRLHLPSKDVVRLLVLFTPDTSGYDDVEFQFRILIKCGGEVVSRVGPFRLWPQQLEASCLDVKAELRRRMSADPSDIVTGAKYAQLLWVDGDAKESRNLLADLSRRAPNNLDLLQLRIKDGVTFPEDKLSCYYHLRELSPSAAASVRDEVIRLLIGRAQKERLRGDFGAYRNSMNEIKEIATPNFLDTDLGAVLTKEEIFVAMIDQDLNTAISKVCDLARHEQWNETAGSDKGALFFSKLKATVGSELATTLEEHFRGRSQG